MRTEHLLLAQYDGKALLPAEVVCRDFFPHLALPKFIRNITEGRIALPLTRIDGSAKAAKFVSVAHLAAYIDAQTAAAEKEVRQIHGLRKT